MSQTFIEPVNKRDINYIKIVQTILSRWYWIVACLIITCSLAYVYLSLIHPRYSANASIMLNEKNADIARILDPNSSTSNNSLEIINQAQSASFIIKSEAFLNKAISRLNYRYSFYYKDRWSTNELYPESPFTIDIIKQDSANFYTGLFNIKWLGGGKIRLSQKEELGIDEKDYNYGDTIYAPGVSFRIVKSYATRNFVYYFRFHTRSSLINRTSLALSVEPQNLNIITVSHTDVNPYFSADVLNAIAKEFIEYEAISRSQTSKAKLAFMDQEIAKLTDELNASADKMEALQKANKLKDLPAKIQADLAKQAQYQSQKDILVIERLNIDRNLLQINVNENKPLINFNLEGPIEAQLAGLISRLNDYIRDREKKLAKYTENSDEVKEVDHDISETKQAIIRNIRMNRDRNEEKLVLVNKKIDEVTAEINNIPADAKELVSIKQEYDTKEKFLDNLSAERLKSRITLSAIEPGASIIYEATVSGNPVSPNKNRIYTMALISGVGAGLFLMLLARVLNRKIQDIGTVRNLTNIPILGLIQIVKRSLLTENPIMQLASQAAGTEFAESIKSLRNSLVFVSGNSKGKLICVSSAMSGEGRTFVAANLASSLAQLDKKVILIDADLRKPSASKATETEEHGLSAYLVNFKSILSIVKHSEIKNLDVISAGISPTNPSELVQNAKMNELLRYLRNLYDYVVIDTSPIAVFTDSIPLLSESDLNLFVLRGGKSAFNATKHLDKVRKEYNLRNFFLVLNGFRNNPLYHPFDSDVDVDIYFNKNYKDYIKRYNSQIDDSKWEQFQQNRA